jgi:uncharacterized protein (DUF2147 family)
MKQQIRINLLTVALLLGTTYIAMAQNPGDILGEWYTVRKRSIITISEEGSGQFVGKTTWFGPSVSSDMATKFKNLEAARNIVYNASDNTYTGDVYNPRKEKYYPAVFKIADNELNITVKRGRKNRTVVWKRK